MKSSKIDGIMFHDLAAEKWLENYAHKGFQKRRVAFNEFLKRVVNPKSTWCDLGCGSGPLIPDLISFGAKVIAIDGSLKMISFAQVNPEIKDPNAVNWLCHNLEDLDGLELSSNKKIDGVLCSSVIEYLQNPQLGLDNINSMLNVGGDLILSVAPKFSLIRTIQKSIRSLGSLCSKDFFGYLSVSKFEVDPKYLQEFLNNSGFVILRINNFDPFLPKCVLKLFRPSLLIIHCKKVIDIK